ncbi:acyl-CoA dehydrogenase [Lujinxingia litoralis]|uniref:Acyl-CoA dehydrogenase n=1 Tax=Lujinxingia litoralis TaxID=2211119 RepID=A0A328C582_9DELT|nr:acyl-CoA dehydrogenase family protein [Lujinxingia litoralis]RAL22481.1 acyl-CoA dehydrogenase [Lujinxingia litoralis]
MIGYGLSDDQKMYQKTARDFARDVIRPASEHHDQTGEYPWEILTKAWELGLLNTMVPAEYGGLGLGALEACILSEEMAWGCTGIGTAMEANQLATAPLIMFGTEEQKKKYLGMLVDGLKDDGTPHMAAYCVTEPGAGSDVQAVKTRAVKEGDVYRISGQKMWITNGAKASWYFVLAYTDPDAGYRGLTGFIVDADTPGIEVGRKEINLGQKASDTRSISFDNVEVPAENVLGGKEGGGWAQAMGAFDKSRPIVASAAVGLARAAFEHARAYSLERTTFGKPIARHQAVSFMLSDMAMNIQAARHLVWESAWLHDQGERNTKQAAFAKAFAADMAVKVASDAVQVYGGYGYSTEYPVEKLYRDSKIFQIYEGTSQIQRVIISREILREA